MTKPETEKLPPHHFETGTGQPLFTAEQMLAAIRAQGGGEWMLALAKEIKANAEDHPGETMSNFALQWADMLAARAIASTPDAAPDAVRMDWLERHAVEVREPALYGSRAMFHAQCVSEDDEEYRTSLREQIDAAIAHARSAGGEGNG